MKSSNNGPSPSLLFQGLENLIQVFEETPEIWSPRGFAQASQKVTHLVEDALREDPAIRLRLGSELAFSLLPFCNIFDKSGTRRAANALIDRSPDFVKTATHAGVGADLALINLAASIPIGLLHWGTETVRVASAETNPLRGLATGIYTFASIPVKGIWDGILHVGGGVTNWFSGNLPETRFGISHEVTNTLGISVLLFFGAKSLISLGKGQLGNTETPASLQIPQGLRNPIESLEAKTFPERATLTENLTLRAKKGDGEAAYELEQRALKGNEEAIQGMFATAENFPTPIDHVLSILLTCKDHITPKHIHFMADLIRDGNMNRQVWVFSLRFLENAKNAHASRVLQELVAEGFDTALSAENANWLSRISDLFIVD